MSEFHPAPAVTAVSIRYKPNLQLDVRGLFIGMTQEFLAGANFSSPWRRHRERAQATAESCSWALVCGVFSEECSIFAKAAH